MATSNRIYQIFQGSPTVLPLTFTVLGSGSLGNPTSRRSLTHPNALLPPITYFSNPDRTFNLDNEVLTAPLTSLVRTLDDTKLVRFDTNLSDVVITEIWTGQEGTKASMPTFFFRALYEYLVNPPDFDPINQEYIVWTPADRSDKSYNVQLFRIAVGGGAENNQLFDISDTRQPGGPNDPNNPGPILGPLDDLDAAFSGVIDRSVLVQMKVVSEAPNP